MTAKATISCEGIGFTYDSLHMRMMRIARGTLPIRMHAACAFLVKTGAAFILRQLCGTAEYDMILKTMRSKILIGDRKPYGQRNDRRGG